MFIFSMTFMMSFVVSCQTKQQSDNFPVLKGPYLGQKPPGMTPEIFSPDVISTASNEHGCAFSPKGEEFYFTRIINDIPTIMCTKKVKSIWSTPKAVSFSGNYLDRLPQMSPDGTIIYFQSRRPVKGSTLPPGEVLIWYTKRTDSNDWSEPQPLDADLGMKNAGASVSIAQNGTIYASGIIKLRPEDGEYAKAEILTPDLKGTYPFISPDESYIIYCSGKQRDLVVSYHKHDNSWTKPQQILDDQKPFWIQGFPIVSPDGKYLFFTADHNIYWISARFLDELKPKDLN